MQGKILRKLYSDFLINIMTPFQKQLQVALKSAPIIYIPHFDYDQIDKDIISVLDSMGYNHNIVYENSLYAGIVNFKTKKRNTAQSVAMHADIALWFEDIINSEIDPERLFLCKNLQLEALSNIKIQALLQTFAAKYQHGDYKEKGDIYSIVIVSPMPVSNLPFEIEKIVTVVEPIAPDMNEIRQLIDAIPLAESAKRRLGGQEDAFREEMTYTLLGLQSYEIHSLNFCTVRERSIGLKIS